MDDPPIDDDTAMLPAEPEPLTDEERAALGLAPMWPAQEDV